jgi:ornithine carbamoyltransferase
MRSPRHFLDIDALDSASLRDMLDRAVDAKKRIKAGESLTPLAGKTLALIFEAPSTRTRISFEVGMKKLGGDVVVMSLADSNMSRGESIADTARVLSRYVDAVMIRTKDHGRLLEMADYADVPVINGLTDRSHPCQLMADVMTFEEHCGPIAGRVVAWSGEGNNMAVSWIHGAARFGFTLRMACPGSLGPPQEALDWAAANGGDIVVSEDLDAMVGDADCVVVDTWASMAGERDKVDPGLLEPYQVDDRVMALAKPEAIFMHCLPAYRGKEMTASVIDGPRSVVWDQAENRLYAQNGILLWCLS